MNRGSNNFNRFSSGGGNRFDGSGGGNRFDGPGGGNRFDGPGGGNRFDASGGGNRFDGSGGGNRFDGSGGGNRFEKNANRFEGGGSRYDNNANRFDGSANRFQGGNSRDESSFRRSADNGGNGGGGWSRNTSGNEFPDKSRGFPNFRGRAVNSSANKPSFTFDDLEEETQQAENIEPQEIFNNDVSNNEQKMSTLITDSWGDQDTFVQPISQLPISKEETFLAKKSDFKEDQDEKPKDEEADFFHQTENNDSFQIIQKRASRFTFEAMKEPTDTGLKADQSSSNVIGKEEAENNLPIVNGDKVDGLKKQSKPPMEDNNSSEPFVEDKSMKKSLIEHSEPINLNSVAEKTQSTHIPTVSTGIDPMILNNLAAVSKKFLEAFTELDKLIQNICISKSQ